MLGKVKVVPYWRKCWRMYSVHAITVLGMLGAIADWMPIVREFVPAWAYITIMALGIVGRMISQDKDDESKG